MGILLLRSCCLCLERSDLYRHGPEGQDEGPYSSWEEVSVLGLRDDSLMGEQKLRLSLLYSGWGAGVSLALLSVILFSSSSSDRRSKEVPST